MIYYIATIKNGQIQTLKLASGDNAAEGVQENGTTLVHIDFPIDNRIEFIETNYWDGKWLQRERPPNEHSSWNGSSWEWDLESLMPQVRSVRNAMLVRSDWTQMPDSPLSEDDKLDWQIYREELRSLSFVQDNISNVKDVDWPAEPK